MSAVREIQVGRGLGITKVQLVDLARTDRGQAWHIVNDRITVCGLSPKHNTFSKVERDLDAKVVEHRGLPVCGKCRELLGPVPMPYLLLPPISG